MSEDLAEFINSLPSLDSNLSEAELIQNASEAYQKYSTLSPEMQSRVLEEANTRLGITPEKLEAFKPDEKTTRVYETATRGKQMIKQQSAPSNQPTTFEGKWVKAAEKASGSNEVSNSAGSRSAARHGYVSPERQSQLERIASIRAEAKRTGKTFSEVADARVAAGR